jgi:hypothetical protein
MDDPQRPAWLEVGRHAFREEPAEELFAVRIQGDVVADDAVRLASAMHGFIRDGRDRLFLMIDMSKMGDIPSSGRRAIAQAILDVPIAATGIYGASFAQRVIATLTDRTNNLIRGGRRYETRFFPNEEQTRAWLAKKRSAMPKP